jgi:hypothetical protein
MNNFKLIVAGGRDFEDYMTMQLVLLSIGDHVLSDKLVSIVSGMARGADRLGALFAEEYSVPLHKFPADWEAHGKRAGFIRNDQMSKFADGLVAFHDKKSRGTDHMIKSMEKLGKFVHVVNY